MPRRGLMWGGLALLLFLGTLLWAKEQDPFFRKWFTVKTFDHSSFKCVVVLPKAIRQHPVVIYAHGSGGNLMNDGNELRQMAELGLAGVSLEYDQTNEAAFDFQFEALLRYVERQKWADTNAIAWVGSSLGANRQLDFAAQHPEYHPQLIVQLSGGGLPGGQTNNPLKSLHCPVLLIHSDHDEIFPLADTKRLASMLQRNGLPVELKILPGMPDGMEPNRGVIFRSIGEYCLTHLAGQDAWRNYHSIAQWQAEAPPLWLFWTPAIGLTVIWTMWSWRCKTRSSEKIKLTFAEIALRWFAVLLAIWALAESALHLVMPRFAVNETTLAIARRYLVQPKQHNNFAYLAAQPVWQGEKLKTLLEHVELTAYNREMISWQLDDKIYLNYVLPPNITANAGEKLTWRRSLWEEFYPRIRHESSLEDAAQIVVRHLRERVTIAALPNLTHDVPQIWLQQITDETGFEAIYVAALRSVGLPARLDAINRAEFWDGKDWKTAPRPLLETWRDLEK